MSGPEERSGRNLTRDERAAAQDITVEDEVMGQLVISRPIQSAILGPLEQAFVTRLRWLLLVGGLLASGLGLLLGLAVSRSLTAPLQRLAAAARAVAGRDFSRRVEVEGSAEIAEVAQAFNEMTTALEQSERQRQNMVADVAHELRTPLSVVQGNLRAILDDVYPLEKAEISRLYDETRLLSRLVDDLRELALADAGQLRLNLRPTDAGRCDPRHRRGAWPWRPKPRRSASTVELAEDLPPVQADPDRLAQVLRNLLVNALRHTPPGGSVTVSARPIAGAVEIAVADTGEGIARKTCPTSLIASGVATGPEVAAKAGAPAWACRWPRVWWRPRAGASGPRAHWGKAAPFGSRCRWPIQTNSGQLSTLKLIADRC